MMQPSRFLQQHSVKSHQEMSEQLYLDKGDAVGGDGDVVAELVEELRRNPQGGAAKFKLVRPETETRAYEHHSTPFIPCLHVTITAALYEYSKVCRHSDGTANLFSHRLQCHCGRKVCDTEL